MSQPTLPAPSSEEPDESPFPYPKIDWSEWEDWPEEETNPFPSSPATAPQALTPAVSPALPANSTSPVALPPVVSTLSDDGELNLYHLLNRLVALHGELSPPLPSTQPGINEAVQYLQSKDATRGEMVRRCLDLAGYLVNEAATLLNTGIDWPTVEAWLCPEEEFVDTPQQWLAIGQAQTQAPTAADQPTPRLETQSPEAKETAPRPELPPALAALVQQGLPPLPPAREQAARRSLGQALRLDRDSEQRRFYAIARAYGLPTGPEAAPAMRAALSALFEIPINSRKELTARQWGQAASAIETEDLQWQVTPQLTAAPLGAPAEEARWRSRAERGQIPSTRSV